MVFHKNSALNFGRSIINLTIVSRRQPVALQGELAHAQGGWEREGLYRAVVKADGDPVPLPGGEQAGTIAGVPGCRGYSP